jgi:hypothetical protein
MFIGVVVMELAEDTVIVPTELNRVWKTNWATDTEIAVRHKELCLPVSARHTTRAIESVTAIAAGPGTAPPPTTCEKTETNVENTAATAPRATRDHLVLIAVFSPPK